MKFKDFKHLVSMNDFDGVVIDSGRVCLNSYNFKYDKRELFYEGFLADTTFDDFLVISIAPHYPADTWYADDYLLVRLEAPSNEL